jgi:hypothetical protein
MPTIDWVLFRRWRLPFSAAPQLSELAVSSIRQSDIRCSKIYRFWNRGPSTEPGKKAKSENNKALGCTAVSRICLIGLGVIGGVSFSSSLHRERARSRPARDPRAEIAGCPSDQKISLRIDKRLSRNSTCTIVVMFLRSVDVRNKVAPRLGVTLRLPVAMPTGGVTIASGLQRRSGVRLAQPNWACSFSPICQLQAYAGKSSSGTSW